ncbi:TlpA family protein disulfide reductase [Sphingobacterium multivorum]|uniref:TlpA family protein disulfide reductase n=1 Tax=Sphingobacterium multivorum TaxID=28454 RepID=UPI0028B1B660|nr:hypothetical protein [Sphingobacterium multivorum]
MRNLSKWDFYAQLKTESIRSTLHHNLENKRFKSLVLVVYFVSMFSLLSQAQPVKAQVGARDIVPLVVGQKVPNEFWNKQHLFFVNGDTVRRSLKEFKGKLLVLDFWSSTCGSCLSHQKEISLYKTKYRNDLNVLMVNSLMTKDNLQRIDKFYRLHKDESFKDGFQSIILDESLQAQFLHIGYPNYIWINASGYFQIQTFRNLMDRSLAPPYILKGGEL